MKIEPMGKNIIVLPISEDNYQTESGLEIVQGDLVKGKVVEFSSDFEGVYKKDDIVVFPKNAGTSQLYNGELHKFLNGKGCPEGDVWAIVTE